MSHRECRRAKAEALFTQASSVIARLDRGTPPYRPPLAGESREGVSVVTGSPGQAGRRRHRVDNQPARLTSPVFDEGAVLQLGDRLLQLGLSVHHDRPIPGDRFLDRLTRDKQKPDAFVAGLDRDFVTAVE